MSGHNMLHIKSISWKSVGSS